MNQPEYFILNDTETVGLHKPSQGSGVVDIGYIIFDIEGKEHERFESLTNPGCAIDPGASAIHGIYDADVVSAPSLESVYYWKDEVWTCGYNGQFDLKFLNHCYEKHQGDFDILRLTRRYITGTANHKLTTIVEHLGVPMGTAHRALGDCEGTLNVLKEISQLQGKSILELWQEQQTPHRFEVMPWGKHAGESIEKVPTAYLNWLYRKPDLDIDTRFTLTEELTRRA